MGELLHGSLLPLLLEHCDYLNIDISQGSVATRLRRGGIFKYELVANLLASLPVKEFWNRLTFGEVMGKSLVSCFFETHGTYIPLTQIIPTIHFSPSGLILLTASLPSLLSCEITSSCFLCFFPLLFCLLVPSAGFLLAMSQFWGKGKGINKRSIAVSN